MPSEFFASGGKNLKNNKILTERKECVSRNSYSSDSDSKEKTERDKLGDEFTKASKSFDVYRQ